MDTTPNQLVCRLDNLNLEQAEPGKTMTDQMDVDGDQQSTIAQSTNAQTANANALPIDVKSLVAYRTAGWNGNSLRTRKPVPVHNGKLMSQPDDDLDELAQSDDSDDLRDMLARNTGNMKVIAEHVKKSAALPRSSVTATKLTKPSGISKKKHEAKQPKVTEKQRPVRGARGGTTTLEDGTVLYTWKEYYDVNDKQATKRFKRKHAALSRLSGLDTFKTNMPQLVEADTDAQCLTLSRIEYTDTVTIEDVAAHGDNSMTKLKGWLTSFLETASRNGVLIIFRDLNLQFHKRAGSDEVFPFLVGWSFARTVDIAVVDVNSAEWVAKLDEQKEAAHTLARHAFLANAHGVTRDRIGGGHHR